MARFARVVIPDVPHHVTQRGNARQVILADDADRLTYLALLREQAQLYRLSLLGYCLMSNHVHLIVVPLTPVALAQSLFVDRTAPSKPKPGLNRAPGGVAHLSLPLVGWAAGSDQGIRLYFGILPSSRNARWTRSRERIRNR